MAGWGAGDAAQLPPAGGPSREGPGRPAGDHWGRGGVSKGNPLERGA